MDEFVQSMSIILTRMLAQAEWVEDCLVKGKYDIAQTENAALIAQIGQLITTFGNELKAG